MGGQDHHWLREVLIRQFGGAPYSADKKTVAYNTDAGVAATQWYIDLVGQAEGGADRLSDRRRHRVPLGQGGA